MRKSLIVILLFVSSIVGAQSNGHLMMLYVNDFRASYFVPDLAYSYTLEAVAKEYTEAMIELDVFAHHTVPWREIQHVMIDAVHKNSEYWIINAGTFYGDIIYQQRESQEFQSATKMLKAFEQSPPHLAALIRPDWKYVGIYQAVDRDPERVVGVFVFAGGGHERHAAK